MIGSDRIFTSVVTAKALGHAHIRLPLADEQGGRGETQICPPVCLGENLPRVVEFIVEAGGLG